MESLSVLTANQIALKNMECTQFSSKDIFLTTAITHLMIRLKQCFIILTCHYPSDYFLFGYSALPTYI